VLSGGECRSYRLVSQDPRPLGPEIPWRPIVRVFHERMILRAGRKRVDVPATDAILGPSVTTAPRVNPRPAAASSPVERLPADFASTVRAHGSCGAGQSSGQETTTSRPCRAPYAYTSNPGRRRIRGCAGCGFAEEVSAPCGERSATPQDGDRARVGPPGARRGRRSTRTTFYAEMA
jgi:hypothetical protein